MWVKICANTNLEDCIAALDAGADALGFIFAESKRRVQPVAVKQIVAGLPQTGERIGLFVNSPAQEVVGVVRECSLTGIQLQGEETPQYIKDVVRMMAGQPLKIIKSFSANAPYEISTEASAVMDEHVDAFLIDSGNAAGRGGTGQVFDWLRATDFVIKLQRRARVIIAGGLTSDNVGSAIRLFRPYGVDVTTGVEREPGKKDPEKLKAFIAAARAAETASSTAAQ
jgi:phosphoribosylanthranilate isomerase